MESLENALNRVDELRRDLSTEIVVVEERGYWRKVSERYSFIKGFLDDKREEARKQLQQIYDSSEWYSARYKAGEGLGMFSFRGKDKEQWNKQLFHLWLNELRNKFTVSLPNTKPRRYAEQDMRKLYDIIRYKELREEIGKLLGIDELDILCHELHYITELKEDELKRIYRLATEPQYRASAGRKLGYSSLRIWAHEHLVAATGRASTFLG